jgi:hypothetical protein
MKDKDEVVVRTYSNEIEADLAASWLKAEGIAYEVISDDAGGALPMLQMTRGIKLVVDRADEDRANEILDRGEEEIDPAILGEAPQDPDSAATRETRREDA